MSKKEKLIERYLSMPTDFHYYETVSIKASQRSIRLMKYLEYKGYTGAIEYSREDKLLFGKVLGIKGLISFEGSTGVELDMDFKEAVDSYLADCEASNIVPERSFKGSFNVRIPSELHRDAALKAKELNTSLNGFVSESIRASLRQKV